MDVAELARDNAELRATVTKLEKERERYRALYQEMLEKARKLELGLLGQKSERMPTSELQLSLQLLAGLLGEQEFVLDEDADDEDDEASTTEADIEDAESESRPKPTGRRRIPESLPVVEIEVVPEEVLQAGLEHFEQVGEEVISTLERRPSSLVCCRIRRLKFLRKDRDRLDTPAFHIAETVEMPIEREQAGAGESALDGKADRAVRRRHYVSPNRRRRRRGADVAPCAWAR